MAISIIVEDGTIVAGANSYISLAAANVYFANLNNAAWAALDQVTVAPSYLTQAFVFMQQAYRQRWQGNRVIYTQVGDWPRQNVSIFDTPGGYGGWPQYYAWTIVPQQVKDAQCILAGKLANGTASLAPDIGRITTSEQVGTLKVTYDKDMPPITIYRDVELLLGPLFKSSGGLNVSVGRA